MRVATKGPQGAVWCRRLRPDQHATLPAGARFAFIDGGTAVFRPRIDLSTPDKDTLQLGLVTFLSRHVVDWPGFMAASVVVLAPIAILFFVAQKTFIEGISFTGLRG